MELGLDLLSDLSEVSGWVFKMSLCSVSNLTGLYFPLNLRLGVVDEDKISYISIG